MTQLDKDIAIATHLRMKCWLYLQEHGYAPKDEPLNDWDTLSEKNQATWLWMAREMAGEK